MAVESRIEVDRDEGCKESGEQQGNEREGSVCCQLGLLGKQMSYFLIK
jgi:hypothetical protein